jgi:hypothetical protein
MRKNFECQDAEIEATTKKEVLIIGVWALAQYGTGFSGGRKHGQ